MKILNIFAALSAVATSFAPAAAVAAVSAQEVATAAPQSTAIDRNEREQIVPVADHHQHLASPALETPATLAVTLPAPLARLLQKRSELWDDPEAMKDIYTEDAIALGIRIPGWINGAERVAWAVGWVAGPLWKQYVLKPTHYRLIGSSARISGSYMYGEDPDATVVGYFHIDAEKNKAGNWRIATEIPSFPKQGEDKAFLASDLIKLLDEAGIQKAVVLSQAYSFDGLLPGPGDEYENVRRENDWTAQQVMQFPGRLVAFCSFNPLRDHALAELERCAKNPAFKGVKLHFGTSPVNLDKPEHVAKTRRIFEAANRLGLPIQVHTSASPEWGRRQAETFINELVSAAPNIQVVVAHLWGGAFYPDDVLSYFADVMSSGQPNARNLYFDVTQAAEVVRKPENLQKIANHMRRIGFSRIYYGSDMPRGAGLPPKESWENFRAKMPLTNDEIRTIADNVAPWVR